MTQQQDYMIQLKDMNKWYGEFHVLKNINLDVKRGEKIVICGPSGSGKSTMIRCINRLEEHQAGSIYVSGTELTEDLKNIEAVRREVLFAVAVGQPRPVPKWYRTGVHTRPLLESSVNARSRSPSLG